MPIIASNGLVVIAYPLIDAAAFQPLKLMSVTVNMRRDAVIGTLRLGGGGRSL